MGQYFSMLGSQEGIDNIPKHWLSTHNRFEWLVMLLIWGGSFYAIGMIWHMLELVERWKGPHLDKDIGVTGVLLAFLLSIVWPGLMVYELITGIRRREREKLEMEEDRQGFYEHWHGRQYH